MKLRLADVFVALVLLAPLALCVGCECKNDADCGLTTHIVTTIQGVGKAAVPVQSVVATQRKCRDKECKNE
jgi:hypothetical protein